MELIKRAVGAEQKISAFVPLMERKNLSAPLGAEQRRKNNFNEKMRE